MAISDVADGIQELDEIIDELMEDLGIPDDDDPTTAGRQPNVAPGVVRAIQRIDDILDEMQKHLGIDDLDKAAIAELARRLPKADFDRILAGVRSGLTPPK